jgi:hypothetical protein
VSNISIASEFMVFLSDVRAPILLRSPASQVIRKLECHNIQMYQVSVQVYDLTI